MRRAEALTEARFVKRLAWGADEGVAAHDGHMPQFARRLTLTLCRRSGLEGVVL